MPSEFVIFYEKTQTNRDAASFNFGDAGHQNWDNKGPKEIKKLISYEKILMINMRRKIFMMNNFLINPIRFKVYQQIR